MKTQKSESLPICSHLTLGPFKAYIYDLNCKNAVEKKRKKKEIRQIRFKGHRNHFVFNYWRDKTCSPTANSWLIEPGHNLFESELKRSTAESQGN